MAINVTVFLKGSLLNPLPGTIRPLHAYFVKVEEGEGIFNQTKIIQSNFTVGNDIYLLDAEPGDYVVIGVQALEEREKTEAEKTSEYDMTKMDFFKEVFFPEKVIEMTKVTVQPESVVFMGLYMLMEPEFKKRAEILDDAQKHYYKVVAPLAYKDDNRKFVEELGKDYVAFGAVEQVSKKDKKQEQKFLKRALRALKGTTWVPILQKRLNELKK